MTEQLDRVLQTVGERPEAADVLLNEVRAYIKRFCAFPNEHCLIAVTLWAAHTHMVEHFHTTPRLALLSPEPASGKTRVLEVLDVLVLSPLLAFNASAPTVYRKLNLEQITLLFDEIDTIWNKHGDNEELRALLNAGYKQGAMVPRCVGPKHDVVDFKVFCAVALAGIGELPDTIMTRSIIIKMRRRAPGETVEEFRPRRHEIAGHGLRDRLASWAYAVGPDAGDAWPSLPAGVEDRNAEIWEPLLAVADAAGGAWPGIARQACVKLIEAAQDRKISLGIRLLGDLKIIFGDQEHLSTHYILDRLTSPNCGLDDDAPWSDLYGKAIDARKLANLLRPYEIRSRKVRIDDATFQGYTRESLHEAWQRYLPPMPEQVEQVEQAEHFGPDGSFVLDVPDVPDFQGGIRL